MAHTENDPFLTNTKASISKKSVALTTLMMTVIFLIIMSYSRTEDPAVNVISQAQGSSSVMVQNKVHLTRVLLMGHGRGGTSFTGELFNRNSNASYWYEPDDAFYSYLAGFSNWHHASELYYPDATPRRLSESEKEEMIKFLDGLLACDTTRMPTELLVHGKGAQEKMSFAKPYRQCLKKHNLYTKRYTCDTHIKKLCSYLPLNDKNQCAARLRLSEAPSREALKTSNAENSMNLETQSLFDKYVNCMSKVRTSVLSKCVRLLKEQCMKTKIRAAKVLRFHFVDIESLISMYPDIKIVHLMRDPRGIVASLLKSNLTRFDRVKKFEKLASDEQLYENEARFVCEKMLIDYQERTTLQKLYPGNILVMNYENIAIDPVATAHEIYRFVGLSMPKQLSNWLYSSTHAKSNNGPFDYKRANGNATAYAWLKRGSKYRTDVAEICREFLQAAGYTP